MFKEVGRISGSKRNELVKTDDMLKDITITEENKEGGKYIYGYRDFF